MQGPRVATPADERLVAAIAARGFQDDPVMSWVFPDPADRPRSLELAFGGLAHRHFAGPGLVYVLEDASVAFWRPPDPVDPVDPVESATTSDSENATAPAHPPFAPEVLERFAQLDVAMTAVHPDEPHWYLGVLSTVPERQSQGMGARIMAPTLATCDAEGVPAYLESSNARNIPFYWRLGFEQTGEIKVPDGPVLYPMWREPRAG